jgi:integrase
VASVSTDASGNRKVQFKGLDGRRYTVYAGKISERNAHELRRLVERILESAAMGESLDPSTASRIAALPDETYAKLAGAGLVHPRESRRPELLAAFCDAYIASRGDLKPKTRTNLEQARKKLVAYFGEKMRLDDITAADAVRYARWLEAPDGGKLSPNTARRLLGRAKQMFSVAVDDELLAKNVFKQKAVKCTVNGNKDRMHFVADDVARKVLDACPTIKWKLIFALARWGGLRTPSETLALRWGDVLWDIGRIRVTVPKLEHHEGHGERWLPIFPELRPLLEQAFDAAEPGTEFVISGDRNSQVNYHATMRRIIHAAGLTSWEKLFQNLRSTRATELAETYPAHVVAAWLGHSVEVGAKHYMQVTDDHFAAATQGNVNSDARPAETGENWVKSETDKDENSRISAGFSVSETNPDPLEGVGKPSNSPRKQGVPARGDVNSDAKTNGTDANPAKLTDLFDRLTLAWRRLNSAGRVEVVELAETLAGHLDAAGSP